MKCVSIFFKNYGALHFWTNSCKGRILWEIKYALHTQDDIFFLQAIIIDKERKWKNFFIKKHFFNLFFRWRNVKDDDESEFRYLEQEVYTNTSSSTKYTVNSLQPFTVYSFTVAAINHVGRSRPSKNSYPSITLRERKILQLIYYVFPWESIFSCVKCVKIIWMSNFFREKAVQKDIFMV